jgi:general transcription factor 3C polypeptide 5 (transcription factor C subunit 1)
MRLPFNYQYSQNPYVRTTDDGDTFNATAVRHVGYFIAAEDPTPMGPQSPPDMTDVRTVEVIADLEAAFAERPLWTRRSLLNHLRGKLRNWNELKRCLNYTAYQFKGGPWRDSVVHYGVDPRSDPKYRQYQTLMFKLRPRNTKRSDAVFSLREATEDHANPDDPNSHLFDGQTYHTDGKVWQVCDITDPLLKDLLDNAPVRPTRDANTGWYHGGLWAKVKAIMKTKLVAIQFGRHLTRMDFAATLQVGDMTPARTGNAGAMGPLPLPNLRLTTEELTILRGREPKRGRHKSFSVRTREQRRPPASTADDQSQAPGAEAEDAEDDLLASDEIDSENEAESGSGSDDESLGEEDLGTDSWMQQ